MFDFSNMNWNFSITEGTYGWFVEPRFLIIMSVAAFFSFFPVFNYVEKNMDAFLKTHINTEVAVFKTIIAIALLYVSMTEVISTGVNPFIYYRF